MLMYQMMNRLTINGKILLALLGQREAVYNHVVHSSLGFAYVKCNVMYNHHFTWPGMQIYLLQAGSYR
jgi:hypothetical protein